MSGVPISHAPIADRDQDFDDGGDPFFVPLLTDQDKADFYIGF